MCFLFAEYALVKQAPGEPLESTIPVLAQDWPGPTEVEQYVALNTTSGDSSKPDISGINAVIVPNVGDVNLPHGETGLSDSSTDVAHVSAVASAVHTSPGPSAGSCPQLIHDVFSSNAGAACKIAFCESGYNPGAIGDSGASLGLFQIQPRWHQHRADSLFGEGASLLDMEVNVRTAYVISSGGTDWSQWSCRTRL